MTKLLQRVWQEEEGQDLVEYAMLLALVILVVLQGFPPLANTIGKAFTNGAAVFNG